MTHVNQEDLIEHCRASADRKGEVTRHLEICGECAREYRDLEATLQVAIADSCPERSPDYGNAVWLSLRNSLPTYSQPHRKWWSLPQQKLLVSLAACALLIFSGFFAGRLWERSHVAGNLPISEGASRDRLVRFEVGEHLERSERLLVQLTHRRHNDSSNEQEAVDLLKDNRLFVQSAAAAGDPVLSELLDRLGRVLVEIANDRQEMDDGRAEQMKRDIERLLFQIRVLRGRTQTGQKT